MHEDGVAQGALHKGGVIGVRVTWRLCTRALCCTRGLARGLCDLGGGSRGCMEALHEDRMLHKRPCTRDHARGPRDWGGLCTEALHEGATFHEEAALHEGRCTRRPPPFAQRAPHGGVARPLCMGALHEGGALHDGTARRDAARGATPWGAARGLCTRAAASHSTGELH